MKYGSLEKMKKAKDYLNDSQIEYDTEINRGFYNRILIGFIKEAQKDAIEYALNLSAELVESRLTGESQIKAFLIDGSSVRKLKEEIFKQLEDDKN